MFFTGDFNAHSQLWWTNGDTTPEGQDIGDLFSSLNLSQIISEPTNFTPHKSPTCIDLIFTDQPNLVLQSGTRPSLDPKWHHDIIYCMINYKIPSLKRSGPTGRSPALAVQKEPTHSDAKNTGPTS